MNLTELENYDINLEQKKSQEGVSMKRRRVLGSVLMTLGILGFWGLGFAMGMVMPDDFVSGKFSFSIWLFDYNFVMAAIFSFLIGLGEFVLNGHEKES